MTQTSNKKVHFVRNEARGTFVSITTNLKPSIRWDTLEDKDYMVVPMVMLTEGVHRGSSGPLLYSSEELAKFPESWNHKPIVVYHPEKNGQGISACDPVVLNSRKIGLILNTRWKGKRLQAEAWLDPERVKKVDNRIQEALEKGEMVELSTGLYTENEMEPGDWNGEEYTAIARNFRPDHLAILPDQKGACSIEDGAGLLRNEASYNALLGLLQKALKKVDPESYCYVEDIFKESLIYSKSGTLYQQKYTSTDTKASLVGEPQMVVKVTQYRTEDGSVVANRTISANSNKESNVKKPELIKALLSTNQWAEDDRSLLEEMNEKALQRLLTNAKAMDDEDEKPKKGKKKPPVVMEELDSDEEDEDEEIPAPVGNKKKRNQVVTLEALLDQASPELRDSILHGMRTNSAERSKLIALITSNARNVFKPEDLQKKSTEELVGIARLAVQQQEQRPETTHNYVGLSDVYSAPAANEERPEPLTLASADPKTWLPSA